MDVKAKSIKRRDPTDFACCGALVGTALVFVIEAYDLFSGRIDDVDPLIHIITEITIFAGSGAMLFTAIAERYNRGRREDA
jgi:hypothetical protein